MVILGGDGESRAFDFCFKISQLWYGEAREGND